MTSHKHTYLHGRDLLPVSVDASGRVAGEEGEGDLDAHREEVRPREDVGAGLIG